MAQIPLKNYPVVILCGGLGTRLREETEYKPKPLVEIGGKPILWHIMKVYAAAGFRRFILCIGYKGHLIREYFLNYKTNNCDFTINLTSSDLKLHGCHSDDWEVTIAETGASAQTGARVKKIEKYIDTDSFLLTYGDGVANVDAAKLLAFHQEHGKIGTITGIHPTSRFGELIEKEGMVTQFQEKPELRAEIVNGGFFVFNKKIFSYLSEEDGCAMESVPLRTVSKDGQLMVYRHEGFWHSMDTYRDSQTLNQMWDQGKAEWKIWKD